MSESLSASRVSKRILSSLGLANSPMIDLCSDAVTSIAANIYAVYI